MTKNKCNKNYQPKINLMSNQTYFVFGEINKEEYVDEHESYSDGVYSNHGHIFFETTVSKPETTSEIDNVKYLYKLRCHSKTNKLTPKTP